MTGRPLRLGTRASPLAMAQAHMVRDALIAAHGWGGEAIEIVSMTASGDRILDRPLAEVGGKALWTKELDRALSEGGIDFAVHSMKDVETIRPPDIALVAMLERADVRDRLVGAQSIDALPRDAIVGTSSPRRSAQLKRLRPDLKIVLFRGNVATRLRKLDEGEAQATLLAAAGLDRLGMREVGSAIPVATMLPAPAQGAIGIETLAANDRVQGLLGAINHDATFACVTAERAFLAALTADCRSPVAALAQLRDGAPWLRGEILSEDGALSEGGAGGDPGALAAALLDRAPPALRAAFG
jgi:hydroxymethylbilane synthase